MSLVSGLPPRPLSKAECRQIEENDTVQGVAPAGTAPITEDGSGVTDLVIVTEGVVVGVALVHGEWELLYRGEKGTDGAQSDLFDEAWTALEESPKTEDERYEV